MKKTSHALIKLQAEMSGYKLHVEVDGINGYRAIEREKPDLVILDVMLPGENGLDVCRKIKGNPELKNIPIMILSAKGRRDRCRPRPRTRRRRLCHQALFAKSAVLAHQSRSCGEAKNPKSPSKP